MLKISDRFKLAFVRDQRGALLAEALAAVSVFTLLGTAVMTSVSATGAASESIRVSATADTLASNQIQEILSNPYVDPPFTFTTITPPTGYSLTAVAEQYIPGDTNIAKIIATDIDIADAPLTIAIGTPLEDDSPADLDREELGRIAEDIMTIQDHLATLLNRVDALSRPRLRAVASLSNGWRPDGDAA
ncbi:MAG: hypothetical protein O2826_03360 [Chloroflexi bacterium]|nr:hypothetical protein [Chloroflexota bacterium]MDA1173539.1 hypothetical protein [Chloroflexota bacterium]